MVTTEHHPRERQHHSGCTIPSLEHNLSEWKRNPVIFQSVVQRLSPTPGIDRPLWANWIVSSQRMWAGRRVRQWWLWTHSHWAQIQSSYMFPPFIMIGRTLTKIVQDMVKCALRIVLFWPSQSWWPTLLVAHPLMLPQLPDILRSPQGKFHPQAVNNTKAARMHTYGSSERFQSLLEEVLRSFLAPKSPAHRKPTPARNLLAVLVRLWSIFSYCSQQLLTKASQPAGSLPTVLHWLLY